MTEDSHPILLAYQFDGNGGARTLAPGDVAEELLAESLTWVHLNAKHEDARLWLESNVSCLDQLVLDALLADETRPRMLEFENGVLLLLRGVNLMEGADPEDMVSIRLWIDPCRIISLERRHVNSIRELGQALKTGRGPHNSGDFLVISCARLLEKMENVLVDLSDDTDDMEERVQENADAALRHDIVDLRRRAILLRRFIAPQREVIGQLRNLDQDWLNEMQRRRLQESYDQITRFVEDLDALRERNQIIKDELTNAISDKLNKNLFILSIVSAIFLPLSFLTGLMGMNVAGIPGAEHADAFWIFTTLTIGIVLAQMALFRFLKWF